MACVLGIQMSHYASACLFRDGRLLAAVPEERLDRVKFSAAFPRHAIRKVLEIGGVSPAEVDQVAVGTRCELFDSNKAQAGEYRKTTRMVSLASRLLPVSLVESDLLKQVYIHTLGTIRRRQFRGIARDFFEELGIPWSKLRYHDHHQCHAAAAFYMSPYRDRTLVFTCDGNGDGDCASVWLGDETGLRPTLRIPSIHSLGGLAARTTKFMGMAPYQDEYKVMGLAPWGENRRAEKVVERFGRLWGLDGLGFRNRCGYAGDALVDHLGRVFRQVRFDRLAYGLQKVVEDILVGWVGANARHHQVRQVACAGGVFLNVKANRRIMELAEVERGFWFPAAGDDSISIGAAILGSLEIMGAEAAIEPMSDLYWGEPIDRRIEEFIPGIDREAFEVSRPADVDVASAELLAAGEIVARCSGRMEYGPRALGNRSIMADPSKTDNVRVLNAMIKSRDFWMPFAGTVLDSAGPRYLEGRASDADPYMIIAYRTRPETRHQIRAATHQADGTIRPQILTERANPGYYRLIRHFERLTGIGAILNTSLNLHGEPVVNLPEEAFHVLTRSHLRHLALGPYLIRKKNPEPVF